MTATEMEMVGRLATPAAALKFILAGNAYFTLRSAKTGVRYTYRVRRAESKDTNQRQLPLPALARANAEAAAQNPKYFVALLAGQDNTSDYVYIGLLENNKFRLTRASKMTSESAPVVALSWSLKMFFAGKLPEALEIWHDGKCCRCGRLLTVPESIASGIGPDCATKV